MKIFEMAGEENTYEVMTDDIMGVSTPSIKRTPPASQKPIPWNSSARVRNSNQPSQELSNARPAKPVKQNKPGRSISDSKGVSQQRPRQFSNQENLSTPSKIGSRVGPKSSQLQVRVVGRSDSIQAQETSQSKGELRQLQLSQPTKAKARRQSQTRYSPDERSLGAKINQNWTSLDIQESRNQAFHSSDFMLWTTGPADTAGTVVDLSDRPLMCMSVRGTEAAIGCADHSVYTVDVAKGKKLRNLYNRKYGHTEWVTCVEHLEDGRILSGALDKKLCLWDAAGVRCIDLLGHDGSVSALKVIAHSAYAISASYDKSLMLWNLDGAPSGGRSSSSAGPGPIGCLRGHRGAVLGFAISPDGTLMSGSREGEVFLWDATIGRAILCCKNAHQGHVTAVQYLHDVEEGDVSSGCMGRIYVTGGQDGIVRVWDTREKAPTHTFALSRSERGRGAVSEVGFTSTGPGSPPLMVAACADKIIRVLEPRCSFQTVQAFSEHQDFIYSLHFAGALMWSGAGDGRLLVHDLVEGKCLYGLGATDGGAVRCVSLAGPKHIVVAGDDGNCMIYVL